MRETEYWLRHDGEFHRLTGPVADAVIAMRDAYDADAARHQNESHVHANIRLECLKLAAASMGCSEFAGFGVKRAQEMVAFVLGQDTQNA